MAHRALLDAANNGNIEAVKQHLDAGVDVNAKDDDGGTPMNWAAVNGRKEAMLLHSQPATVILCQ